MHKVRTSSVLVKDQFIKANFKQSVLTASNLKIVTSYINTSILYAEALSTSPNKFPLFFPEDSTTHCQAFRLLFDDGQWTEQTPAPLLQFRSPLINKKSNRNTKTWKKMFGNGEFSVIKSFYFVSGTIGKCPSSGSSGNLYRNFYENWGYMIL